LIYNKYNISEGR